MTKQPHGAWRMAGSQPQVQPLHTPHACHASRLEQLRTARGELAHANAHIEAALAAMSPAAQSTGPQAAALRGHLDACYTALQ